MKNILHVAARYPRFRTVVIAVLMTFSPAMAMAQSCVYCTRFVGQDFGHCCCDHPCPTVTFACSARCLSVDDCTWCFVDECGLDCF